MIAITAANARVQRVETKPFTAVAAQLTAQEQAALRAIRREAPLRLSTAKIAELLGIRVEAAQNVLTRMRAKGVPLEVMPGLGWRLVRFG